jgi:precorrin-6A/cobalt-precorrin-6A reductase
LRVLILGGSSEASALARALAGRSSVDAVLSLAGRTASPILPPLPLRTGGFGGIPGLVDYLRAEAIGVMVDATHPFAEQMSGNAQAAAAQTGIPLIRLTRPAWQAQEGDRWTEVADIKAAVDALGESPRRVFLTVGRLQLAAFARAPRHFYLVRTIDPVGAGHGLRAACFLEARGPFVAEDEERLMREHAVELLVTKNSGGTASAGKLEAARRLGLPVVLVRQPAGAGAAMSDIAEVIAAIEAHHTLPALRGV